MEEEIKVTTEEEVETKETEKKKDIKVKKKRPKKERVMTALWIVFAIILVILYVIKFAMPNLLVNDDPKNLKHYLTLADKLMADEIEYTNKNGETHKYYLVIDHDYFNKDKDETKGTSPLRYEREEKDGTRTDLQGKDVELCEDDRFGDELTAVQMMFFNTATKRIGIDIAEKIYPSDGSKSTFNLATFQRIFDDILIFYTIFFVIYSIFAYYQIWSRHYDEKLEREELIKELNREYQQGMSKEQANQRTAPKKLTKKQKREMNKNNRS